VALLERQHVAVVLLDIFGVRPEGFDTARLMRQRGCTAPLIFVTALEFSRAEFDTFQTDAGVVVCVVKPFDAKLLRAQVEGCVKQDAERAIKKGKEPR